MMRYLIIFCAIAGSSPCLAKDSIREAIGHSEAAIRAQRARLEIVAQNIANESSVGLKPGLEPYRRKLIFFREKYDTKLKRWRVKIVKRGRDYKTKFKGVYDPDHLSADSSGVVLYPNVITNIELRDSMEAKASIEANIAAIEVSKKINNDILELIK